MLSYNLEALIKLVFFTKSNYFNVTSLNIAIVPRVVYARYTIPRRRYLKTKRKIVVREKKQPKRNMSCYASNEREKSTRDVT